MTRGEKFFGKCRFAIGGLAAAAPLAGKTMRLYGCAGKSALEPAEFSKNRRGDEASFILCRAQETLELRELFGWDESNVAECSNLDESVRYTSYDGYDFVSLVHMELEGDSFALREINLYVSGSYLVLVLPEHSSAQLSRLEKDVEKAAAAFVGKAGCLNKLYFLILYQILADFSNMLEGLEDQMEELSETIAVEADPNYLTNAGKLRRMTYSAKKQLRALSYLGSQILIDENGLIDKKQARYFRSLEARTKKLYDFAESLYELSNELQRTHDSRLTIKMNDTVNKLTLLTLFFGPLTIITGIYGMNFEFMPELRWPFGYPLAIALMVTVNTVLYVVLKKKKWM
jgi:magnesium transporter